jgi:hypothetical protein
MSKSAYPSRARGPFRIYAYAAQLDIAIHVHPSLFVEGTTR